MALFSFKNVLPSTLRGRFLALVLFALIGRIFIYESSKAISKINDLYVKHYVLNLSIGLTCVIAIVSSILFLLLFRQYVRNRLPLIQDSLVKAILVIGANVIMPIIMGIIILAFALTLVSLKWS
jgi:hypothetical protein